MASRRLRLWTASALAVALQTGMGCQARRLPTVTQVSANQTVLVNHPPDARPVLTSEPSRHWAPGMRIFRGSVSSVSVENDLIVR